MKLSTTVTTDALSPIQTDEIWTLYHTSFEPINDLTPCKQSFDEESFRGLAASMTVTKCLVQDSEAEKIVGFCLLSNDFNNSPWISAEYFAKRWPESWKNGRVYYFMGIATAADARQQGIAMELIRVTSGILAAQIDVLGFDHSLEANPFIPKIASALQSERLKMRKLGSQEYYVLAGS